MTTYTTVYPDANDTPHAVIGPPQSGLKGAKTVCGRFPRGKWHDLEQLDVTDPPEDLCGLCASNVAGLDPDDVPRTEDA